MTHDECIIVEIFKSPDFTHITKFQAKLLTNHIFSADVHYNSGVFVSTKPEPDGVREMIKRIVSELIKKQGERSSGKSYSLTNHTTMIQIFTYTKFFSSSLLISF